LQKMQTTRPHGSPSGLFHEVSMQGDNVIKLPSNDPDSILAESIGDLSSVCLIGMTTDGELVVRLSQNLEDAFTTLGMIEHAKHALLRSIDD
jgi:hypothetical protein